MDAGSFEACYHERARTAIAPYAERLALVLPDRLERPGHPGTALAGWWLDEAGAGDRVVLPNPYDGVEAIATMESWVWDVASRLAPKLGAGLDTVSGRAPRGASYWHVLLSPWLVHLLSALADRLLFCRTVAALLPAVPLAVASVPDPPSTTAESLQRLRTDDGNSGLLAMIAARLSLPTVADPGPPPAHDHVAHRSRSGREAAIELGRALIGIAPGATLAALPRRRIGLVGLTRLNARELTALERRVRGLAPLPRPLPRAGVAAQPDPDPALRARLDLGERSPDPLEQLATDAMPELLPASLLEGFEGVQRESARRYGRRPLHVVVGNYSVDESQNEFFARCRAAGKRFAFAQHGGMYLQSPVNAQERLEVEPGSQFWSWGASGSGVVATPNPYLERLRDTHRGGTRITIVEPLEPPDAFVVRFAGHPLANQGYESARMLAELVTALPQSRRERLALKRFPNAIGVPSRPDVLEALPADGPARAADWMVTSRLAVIPYLDTPFIEAIVIGTPTLGLWNPGRWPLRAELEPLFARLHEVGILHADAPSAAAQIDRVYDDAQGWWRTSEVARVRAEFIGRFAIAGDPLRAWGDQLIELGR